MVRRSLGVALWSLVGLLACFLGALNGLVGTRAGRSLLARIASNAVERAVSGTIEVGDVRGSLISGVVLTNVRLFDADTSLVASLPRVELSYNPLDFVAGRVVLFEVVLDRPVFNIVQHANGKINLEELLRLDVKDTGPRGPRPLVLLRNVRITDGSVNLRLQDRLSAGDSLLEIDPSTVDGRRRIRRFEHFDARLAAFRVSAPRERGVRIDISRLAFQSSDPHLTLADAAGRITITGDTLDADLVRVRFPGSQFSARGRVTWQHGPILWDLALRADSATLTDLAFIDPRFPPAAVLRGGVGLRSHGPRVLEIKLDPLDVSYGGGTLTGRVTAFSATDTGIVAVRQGDLVANDLSLELARPFLDTLPFYGRLTGHTIVDGPTGALHLETDWVFRDSLVPGWPTTRIRGRGEVDVRGRGVDLGFRPFEVEAATLDLRTVRRLVPAIGLVGELDAVGTLNGTLHNAHFSGTLRHRDHDLPVSVVRGVVTLDSRTDTLGVSADVTTDSLSLDGLHGSFPSLPLRGTLAGTIRLTGNVAALEAHTDLGMVGGESGSVRGDGFLVLGVPGYGVRDFTLRGRDVNLERWLAKQGPPSRLSFTVSGSVVGDRAAPPVGGLTAALAPSLFAGSVVDSGSVRLRFADGRLYVESLRLQQPGLLTRGSGSLGWRRPTHGSLSLDVDADSLQVLDSLATWLASPGLAGPTPGEALRGSAQVLLTLDGALDSVGAQGRATATDLRWRGWRVPAGKGRATYQPGVAPVFEVEATLDSLGYGRLGFGAAQAHARGTRDSLTWFARSRVGDLGAFLAGGRYARVNAGQRVGVDSLALLLPGSVWFLERPVQVTISDSSVALDTLSLKSAAGSSEGGGRLVISGEVARHGRADARVYVETFPLAGVYALLQRDTLGVAGAVTATVALGGTRANPTYNGSFALSNGAFGAFRAPFMDGTVAYKNRRVDGEVHLWRSGQQILNVTARLPLDLALMDVAQRQLPDTLSVQARADSVDLTVLEAVTPLLRQVRGVFDADLGIGGTWDAPQLRGGLEITGAAATIPALNVRYEDIGGRLVLLGDTIRVQSLTARSEKGRAEVTGYVRLDRLTRPVLDLNIAATEFKALDLKGYLAVTASGQLGLGGPVFGATLTGRGTVTEGVLHFADLVNKRVVNLDEPWVQDLIDTSLIRTQRLGPEFESVFLDSLRIQGLQLTMGSDVWLRSTEANIQLTGSVTVNKVRDNYLLSGTLQAPRGTYRLLVGPVSREFVVNQGTVRYFGTPDLDAELDIEARHVVHSVAGGGASPCPDKDITIVGHIRGSLLVPHLTLEAERCQLSQTEIISYLMFGRPSFELAGGQGALMRSTAASLVAGEVERTVVSDLGVPLDYFEFRPGDPTDRNARTQLAAGWQIGDKTFLVLNAGFCQRQQVSVANTLGATLQYRISPEWRTEASFEPVRNCASPNAVQQSASAARQVGVDLFWERRY